MSFACARRGSYGFVISFSIYDIMGSGLGKYDPYYSPWDGQISAPLSVAKYL